MSELRRRNVFRVAIAYVVIAWVILEAGDVLAPALHLPEWVVSALVFFLLLGFPLVLVIAWAFELTPEGIRREKHVDRGRSITHITGRKLDYLIIGALAIALMFFAFDKWVLQPARDTQALHAMAEGESEQDEIDLEEGTAPNSIAVLAFADLSPEGDQEYFSDGISEEILNVLARVPGLRVTSRSSSFSFKGKDVDIPTVAKRLSVANVLEGSVRKSGNRVRVTAQLIDAKTDTHIWSETYDRELHDIFAIQDEIAVAIRDELNSRFGMSPGKAVQPNVIKTANADAYDAYLLGRNLVHLRGRENLEDAVGFFERSLHFDSDFAPAHAQLAIATILLLDSPASYGELSLEEVRRKAVPHLRRALELEPDLAEAYGGLALLAINSGDLVAAIEYGRKALDLNPSYVDAMHWLYISLSSLGEYEEREAVLKRHLEVDPLSISGRVVYAIWLGREGRIDEAREVADQLLAQNLLAGFSRHADLSLGEGQIAESLYWALKAHSEDPSNMPSSGLVAWIFTLIGERDEARRIDEGVSLWVDVAEGRFDQAIKSTQSDLLLDRENEATVEAAANVLYFAGRIDEALPHYERMRDFHPDGRPIGTAPTQVETTMRLAVARRKAGHEVGAQAAAQIAEQALAALNAAGANDRFQRQAEAMIAAFDRDSDGALEALKMAIRHGLRWSLFLDDPVFEYLHSEPRFVALRQYLAEMLDEEHEKVLQLICFSNPVFDEWQPSPETCDEVEDQRTL